MTEKQTWAALAVLASIAIGAALYLGVDLAEVGRALTWLREFLR